MSGRAQNARDGKSSGAVRFGGEAGAVMIEASLVTGLFLLLLIVTVEAAIVGYTALTTQYVASRAARFAMVSTIPGAARTNAVITYIVSEAASFGIHLDPASQIRICPIYKDPSCVLNTVGGPNDAGGPGDFVLIRLWSPGRFLLGQFHFPVRGESLTKNEYF